MPWNLELELQIVVGCHVAAEDQTRVFHKSSKCQLLVKASSSILKFLLLKVFVLVKKRKNKIFNF